MTEFITGDQRAHEPFDLVYDPALVHELTGLPNRTALEQALNSASINHPGNFGVIFADLDGLKQVNDSETHRGGDQYILTGAAVLQASIRANDILGLVTHLSGDEFVLIVTGVTSDLDMKTIIDRIQPIMDDHGIPISMGGKAHTAGETASELLTAADRAMYRAKIDRVPDLSSESRGKLMQIKALLVELDLPERELPKVLSALAIQTMRDQNLG